MSESENIIDNTSENEVLSNAKQSVVGDIYVQDVHKSFGVTKALDGVNLVQILERFMPLLAQWLWKKHSCQSAFRSLAN